MVELKRRCEKVMGSKKLVVCFQMNLDGLRTWARDFAGPEGPEGACAGLAVEEVVGMDFVEIFE